jgi:hypothetical protein
MNQVGSTLARHWLRLILVTFCASSLIIFGVVWQQRRPADELMTLSEALWVTERDFSQFYPPGSTESQSIAQALIRQTGSFAERRFDSFVLYRLGLTDTDPGSEPLLVVGFDPIDNSV